MTEAQYMAKLRSALRKAFRWWLPMKEAKQRVRRPSRSSNTRLKWEYQCAHCTCWFPEREVEVDHVIPCGTLKTLEDIPVFVQRLTPEDIDSFQVLCKPCHKQKTKLDNDNGKTNS